MNEIGPIRNDEEHRAALRVVSAYVDLDPELGSPEGDRLERLVAIVETWERGRWPARDK